ncbi:MAG: AsmA family protein [Deltaproteobacteria bacterium]|nr:MAG: AsmA family protein [Deltaproteobacteria bacterium]
MKRSRIVLLSILGVIVVAVVVGVLVLDSVLTSKAHEEADKLSQQLGRKVEIGSVATKIVTGLGVRVSDVSVGPGPGEDLPLVQVPRIEVKAALVQALRTRGKEVTIRSAEIEGLKLNVIRFKDGTTNLERLQKAMAEKEPKKPEEPKDEKPSDLSWLRVDHAALKDARIALVDKTGAAARELAIQNLDVIVNDLRAGKALDVFVSAAVLADKRNFEVRLHAPPLPPTLMPTPDKLTLKIEPIDLTPLGPFVPKDIGLQSGKLDANFEMALGGVVTGGTGPTRIAGTLHGTGLKFAGAEGGRALDVSLDADVKGDSSKGDVQIDKLKLDLGPAGITGQGKATGLASNSPRIEGLEIRSHDLDPEKLAAYYPPLRKSLKGQISGPIGLLVHASGTQASAALELSVDLTPVKLAVPDTLSKAAGAPMMLLAHARGAGGGKLAFDTKLDLAGVDLRPGESLNKAPGQRLELTVQGTRSVSGSSDNPDQRIDLASLVVRVLGDELSAKGFLETKGAGAKKATNFDLTAQSAHLDLDKLLYPNPSKKEKPPPDPKTFAGINGHAKVNIESVRVKKQDLSKIVADVEMHDDQVVVKTAQVGAFAGQIDASGTSLRLAHPKEPWHVVTKARGIDLAQASLLGTPKKVLAGKFNGDIKLDGSSQDLSELTKNLTGLLEGHLEDGQFLGKDIIASVTGPLMHALPSALQGKVTKGGVTDLGKDTPFGITIQNGLARLKQPITVTKPEAQMTFSGGIHLDGTLDLPGTVALAPETIATLTGGKVRPSTSIPVGIKLTGPVWNPQVADLDLKGAVAAILKSAGTSVLGGVLGNKLGVQGSPEQIAQAKQSELQQKAQAEQAKAEQRAKDEADAQRKKVQEDAQKKLKGLFGR